jgi:heme/copper-type cytochrome/quinol oxidase subunit 1
MATVAIPRTTVKSRSGIMEWLTTVDHKKIGLLYIVTSFLFFLSGGVMALFIRLELAQPGAQIVSADTYNMLFTMHGTTMIFLFVIPMSVGLGNYLVPLMIGARDMAFRGSTRSAIGWRWVAVSSCIAACWSSGRKPVGRDTVRWRTASSPNLRAPTCGSWDWSSSVRRRCWAPLTSL